MKVELVQFPGTDTCVRVNGLIAFSFCASVVERDGTVRRPTAHERAAFYSLYVHDNEGVASCVGDADTEVEIKELLHHAAGTWLVAYARHIVADLASVAQALADIEQALKSAPAVLVA